MKPDQTLPPTPTSFQTIKFTTITSLTARLNTQILSIPPLPVYKYITSESVCVVVCVIVA